LLTKQLPFFHAIDARSNRDRKVAHVPPDPSIVMLCSTETGEIVFVVGILSAARFQLGFLVLETRFGCWGLWSVRALFVIVDPVHRSGGSRIRSVNFGRSNQRDILHRISDANGNRTVQFFRYFFVHSGSGRGVAICTGSIPIGTAVSGISVRLSNPREQVVLGACCCCCCCCCCC